MAKRRKALANLCVIYSLHEQNPEFHKGFRFRVHDIDDDKSYFHDKQRMFDMLAIHSFSPVLPEVMEKARVERAAAQARQATGVKRKTAKGRKANSPKLRNVVKSDPEPLPNIPAIVARIVKLIQSKCDPASGASIFDIATCKPDLELLLKEALDGRNI